MLLSAILRMVHLVRLALPGRRALFWAMHAFVWDMHAFVWAMHACCWAFLVQPCQQLPQHDPQDEADIPCPCCANAGRLAMLAVVTALAGEYLTGLGISEQTADHPIMVFASFVIISIATYVPIFK
jgi:hypothetical protein